MFRTITRRCAGAIVLLLLAGCAAQFSPQTIRNEIVSQSGQDPLGVFEVNLGRFTTLLLKNALAGADGELPFAGLRELQLATYAVPPGPGPVLDVTRIDVRGWESVVRSYSATRSAMVIIRPDGDTVGDIVVVGAGLSEVVYARLKGALNPQLPASLGRLARDGGPAAVRRALTQLAQ